jgi:hypothetical protein
LSSTDTAGAHLLDEVHRVGLVELEHGDVGVEPAGPVDLVMQGGDDAAGEVRPRGVREHLQPLPAQQVGEHLRGGRLAVRAADDDDPLGQPPEGLGHEVRVEAFHDVPGQRRPPATQPRDGLRQAGRWR